MKRRAAVAGIGTCVTGLLAGCLGNPLDSTTDVPRLVGLVAGNWHPEPQTLNVFIESGDDILYETQIQLPGGDPSAYDRPSATRDGHPSELPPSATLVTWVEKASRDDAATLDFGGRNTDCIGIEIDICPTCGKQKGQADITVPDVPDTLIKYTSSCQYG
jgi:hypothetical protein